MRGGSRSGATAGGGTAAVVRAAALVAAIPLALAGCGSPDDAETLTVLAAASLADVLPAVADDLEADHPGLRVELSFAASSTVVQQVDEGAPADVVALADEAALDPLDPRPEHGDPVLFATNTLRIVVPADNPAGIGSPDDLERDGVRLVVCAAQVPCGRATATLLEQLGIEPAVASHEQDVRATLTKVVLGEADAGVVYATDAASASDAVSVVPLPAGAEVRTAYPVLRVSDHPLADAFVEELLSERGRAHLADAGFGLP